MSDVQSEKFELQIASDLHIEYKNDDIPNPLDYLTPKAPNLVLAGDIGTFYKYEQLHGFISALSPIFKHIIYVFGNHEYYKPKHKVNGVDLAPLTMADIRKRAKEMQNDIPNLWILDNAVVRIGNHYIIGATLWSDIQITLPKNIVKIHGMTTRVYTQKFNDGVKFLTEEINKCREKGRKAIVITHYPPTYNVLPEDRLSHKNISLYASNLDDMFGDPVDAWICGHVHHNFDENFRWTFFGILKNLAFCNGQTPNVHSIVPYLIIYEELKIFKTL